MKDYVHFAKCRSPETTLSFLLALDADGRRLAKRRDDLSLALLRNHGVDPRAVVSWVARSAGFDVSSRVTTAELASSFELGRASREPVRLTAASIAEMLSARD